MFHFIVGFQLSYELKNITNTTWIQKEAYMAPNSEKPVPSTLKAYWWSPGPVDQR